MAKKETAEQKLLKIIEATKKAQESSSGAGASTAAAKPKNRFSFSIQKINFILIIAVIASLIYLGFEVTNGLNLLQQDVTISADASAPRAAQDLSVPPMKSLSYYLDKISSRNIFQPYQPTETQAQPGEAPRANLESKLGKYKLVGIAWLDVPESATVMVEDTTTGMTRFLKEGDKLDDVTIKTIYTDRVVVGYENEEMVIKL